ncbi:MAG: endonuclease [Opitutaceae bacterium]
MPRWLVSVLFAALSFARGAPPPGYYDRAAGLSGGPLKVALHEIVRGHTLIPYSQLHAPLARLHEDPANANNVILLYSADSVPKGADFVSAAWNREHAWPRSRGNADETGPDDSDLHYIWPCYDAVNSTRVNLPFDLSTPADPGFRAPGHPLAPATSLDSDSWQPPAGQRGALARCLFYVAVRYEGDEPATSDMELVSYQPSGSRMGNLNTLLRWHADEPVTDAERRRNDLIFSDYQRNRNPFIDQPEWAGLIWGSPLPGAAGSRPLVSVTTTVANASEQPRYSGEFKITLAQAAPPGGVQIDFQLTGTSAPAADYALSGPGLTFRNGIPGGALRIDSGATSGTISLSPVVDAITEPAETATLVLEQGVGYTVVPNATRSASVTLNDQPALPAAWRFDGGAPFANPLPAETGNAVLSFDAWGGSITSFSGVTGDALALVGSEGNGSSVLISLSMAGQRDLAVGFQTRGTATSFNSGTWAWSIDGAVFTPLAGSNTASTSTTFGSRTVNFPTITALNNASNVTLRYTLSGATSSSANTRIDDLMVSATPIAAAPNASPQIINQLEVADATAGGSTLLFVSATGRPAPAYQWFKDSVTVAGATSATLSIAVVSAGDAGSYTATATNALGQAQSTPIELTVRPSASRLINVATRAAVGGGDAALIAGFVIGGTENKTVLIRGAGPALVAFGVNSALPDPALELFRGTAKLAENDDWLAADSAAHAAAGAFVFPTGSKDAAFIQTLAPGAYTVHLGASPNTTTRTGIGLIEVFELTPPAPAASTTRLINLSTRAFVGAGQDILIPGVVVGPPGVNNGNSLRTVLIRAVGPGLADFDIAGFLTRPQLKVILGDGTVVAENIGWQSAAHREALLVATARVGAFPLSATRADSAVLVSLMPVPYTIQVSGADGGSGVALIEVYEVP